MPDLTDADALGESLTWLGQHPAVLAGFGGPDHVSALREAPWPHLQVTLGLGGQPENYDTQTAYPEITLTTWGHPDGSDGSHELWRLALTAVKALREMRTAPYRPGRPVFSRIEGSAPLSQQNLTNGQRRWIASMSMTVRPPMR